MRRRIFAAAVAGAAGATLGLMPVGSALASSAPQTVPQNNRWCSDDWRHGHDWWRNCCDPWRWRHDRPSWCWDDVDAWRGDRGGDHWNRHWNNADWRHGHDFWNDDWNGRGGDGGRWNDDWNGRGGDGGRWNDNWNGNWNNTWAGRP
ncbi:hypothetical protein ABZ128_09205 [Streptomyces sp. NPDC006326]|uniref:hypothetical protein n=1 Tax=Streptomyces sp. NPDC006326 TaxID=3156752 RepID=UPI0033A56026